MRSSADIIGGLPASSNARHTVDAALFSDKPLTSFDDNFQLIDGLLKFLQIFADKNAKAKKDIEKITIAIMQQKDEYNKNAGFLAKMTTDWIALNNEERTKVNKLGYIGTEKDVIKKMFHLEMLKQFVSEHVKDRYKKTDGKTIESEPERLVDAVYNLIEFNALSPEARLYSDTHSKELPGVSATDLQGKQLFASIKMAMGNMEKTKLEKQTSQLAEMTAAMKLISDRAMKGSTAYDAFKAEHAVKNTQARADSPEATMTEEERLRSLEEVQSALENLQRSRAELIQFISESRSKSTLKIDYEYLTIIENAIAGYEAANQKKMAAMKPTDQGYERVKRLTTLTREVGAAAKTNDQEAVNKSFNDLVTLVDNIMSGRDYGKLHTKRKSGLDSILSAKMAAGVELALIGSEKAAAGLERRPSLSSIEPATPPSPPSPDTGPKVLSSTFSDKPLVSFNTNMNLITQLLNYLHVFAEKSPKATQAMQDIITNVMQQQERYNSKGGLIAKGDLNWIVTNSDEKAELKKGSLAEMFQLDAIELFIDNHVKKKYQDIPGKISESAPKDLVKAVFDMIKMNALPSDARLYGETMMKKTVSATDLAAQTAKGNLVSSLAALTTEKTQNKTTQQTELVAAELQINSLGGVFASEWNNYRTQQRVQEKAEAKTVDEALVVSQNANAALKLEIEEMQKPTSHASTVIVNKDYIRAVILALEEYRTTNTEKLDRTAVKDPGLRRLNELSLKVKQVQQAVNADSQPDTTKRFQELKEFVARIVSGKDYSVGHIFTKHKTGLDVILERKMKAAEELGLTREAEAKPEVSVKLKS